MWMLDVLGLRFALAMCDWVLKHWYSLVSSAVLLRRKGFEMAKLK